MTASYQLKSDIRRKDQPVIGPPPNKANYILFDLVSDYTLLIFSLVKVIAGAKFVINLIFVGKMDEEFIMDKFGRDKWETRV